MRTPTIFLSLLGLLGIYLLTSYPSLSPYRDSGDLAAAACTLGIPHPSGYPLYVLAGKPILSAVGLGNPAYRLNAASAAFGASAAVLAGLAAVRLASSSFPLPVFLGVFLLAGLSPALWRLSQVSEMYSLSALFAAGLLLLWPRSPHPTLPPEGRGRDGGAEARGLYLCALLFGLGLGIHQTLVLGLPAFLWVFRRSLRRGWPAALGLFLLGLTAALFLPLRSLQDPVLDWGEPRTLRNLFRVLTRADYGGIRLHPGQPAGILGPGALGRGLVVSFRAFADQAGVLALALSALGAVSRRRRPEVQAALAAFVLSGPFFIVWSNLEPAKEETLAILEPHLILPLVYLAVLFGAGLETVLERLKVRWSRPWVAGAVAGLLVIAPVGERLGRAAWTLSSLPGTPSYSHPSGAPLKRFPLPFNRSNFSSLDYGKSLLASLPPGSVLMDPDDPTAFVLSYLSRCEGLRADVIPVSYFRTRWGYRQLKRRHPELFPAWEIVSGVEVFGAVASHNLKAGRPVFTDLPQKLVGGQAYFPSGLAYRLLPPQPSAPAPKGREDHLKAAMDRLEVLRFRPVWQSADFFSRHALQYWSSALNNTGVQAMSLDQNDLARDLYLRSLAANPSQAEAWNNWGNLRMKLGDLPGAEAGYKVSVGLRPTAQVLYNLGRVYWLGQRLPEAKAAFERAMEAGDLPDPTNDLGLVLYRQGERGRAVELWTRTLQRWPQYPPAMYNLGMAHFDAKDYEQARLFFAAYRQASPNPVDRKEADQWLGRIERALAGEREK